MNSALQPTRRILMKKMIMIALIAAFCLPAACMAQEAEKQTVSGSIKEIAKDGLSILVETTTVVTTKEFVDNYALQVGDKVEVTVEKDGENLKAVECKFMEEAPEEEKPAPNAL
jgi:hypothetical protein